MTEESSAETPRERRHERTRDAIINTARKLIVEKGVDRLSLREIARRIDYSPAGLYEYFGSKDEIIDAVCQESFDGLSRAFSLIDESLPLETYLLELGVAYIDFARHHPDDFMLMFSRIESGLEHPPQQDELQQDNSFAYLYNAVSRGVNSGEIVTHEMQDAMEITYALWSLVHGMATLQISFLTSMTYDFEAVDRRALQAFLSSIFRS